MSPRIRQGSRLRARLSLAALGAALLVLSSASGAQARSAYLANYIPDKVSAINTLTNQLLGSPITVGTHPEGVAISPDGKFAYVTNSGSGNVSVIDTATNQAVGSPIPASVPIGVATTPNGKFAYVVNFNSIAGSVTVIDTQTRAVVGSPISVAAGPVGVAISPDGKFAYVASELSNKVTVIDTQARQVVGSPISVGSGAYWIAITPDGKFAYVTNSGGSSVSVIDTQTKQVVGSPITVGSTPVGIAISPDGKYAYVANQFSNNISVIDTATNQVVGSAIAAGGEPFSITFSPDGRFAYVTNTTSDNVTVIDTQTKQPVGSAIPVGDSPMGIAIVPDQSPTASFTARPNRPKVPVAFNGSASSDPDGTVARYDWNFGDGKTNADGPTPKHAYSRPGAYTVKLTVTDDEGCSVPMVFTGQTASCSGAIAASQTLKVKVAYPGVRVACPKRAGHGGCVFKLQAITKRHRCKSASSVARKKVKAGATAIVSLKPKGAFRAKLARARKILVERTVVIGGARRTSFPKLKVVR